MFAEVATGSSNSTAQIITAVAAIVTALGGVLLAFAVLLPILRNGQSVKEQVSVVHTIVNQQRTDSQRYNIALMEALKKHGIEVPVDQSLPVPGREDARPGEPT